MVLGMEIARTTSMERFVGNAFDGFTKSQVLVGGGPGGSTHNGVGRAGIVGQRQNRPEPNENENGRPLGPHVYTV